MHICIELYCLCRTLYKSIQSIQSVEYDIRHKKYDIKHSIGPLFFYDFYSAKGRMVLRTAEGRSSRLYPPSSLCIMYASI
jgi:hypothetical protein